MHGRKLGLVHCFCSTFPCESKKRLQVRRRQSKNCSASMVIDTEVHKPPLYFMVRIITHIRYRPLSVSLSLSLSLACLIMFSPRTGWKSPASHDIRARFPSCIRYQRDKGTGGETESYDETCSTPWFATGRHTPACEGDMFLQQHPDSRRVPAMLARMLWEVDGNTCYQTCREATATNYISAGSKHDRRSPCREAKPFVECCQSS